MSFKLSSSSGFNSRGWNFLRLSEMFISGRVVTRNRIQHGRLIKCSEISSSSSLCPRYSLSSNPSITIRMFLSGAFRLLRGTWNSNSNSSLTSTFLSSIPRFLESALTRAFLYSGSDSDNWLAKDWSITFGFLWRALSCWQKWLQDNLPVSCSFLQRTAEMTDFPIPAFPLITVTRFWELLSSNQFSTFVKMDTRVPSRYLSVWYFTSSSESIFAIFVRISSSLCFLPSSVVFFSPCSMCFKSARCFSWFWRTFSSLDFVSSTAL